MIFRVGIAAALGSWIGGPLGAGLAAAFMTTDIGGALVGSTAQTVSRKTSEIDSRIAARIQQKNAMNGLGRLHRRRTTRHRRRAR
jgi:hypothetical protein